MTRLLLPQKETKLIDACECIFIRLFSTKTGKAFSLKYSNPSELSKLLLESCNQGENFHTRWGEIPDIVEFINENQSLITVEGLEDKIANGFAKKELQRVKRKNDKKQARRMRKYARKMEEIGDYALRILYQIDNTDPIKNKVDLLQRLNHLDVNEIYHIDTLGVNQEFSIKSPQMFKNTIVNFSDKDFKYFVKLLNRQLRTDKINFNTANELETFLNEKGLPYGIETVVIELVKDKIYHDSYTFGVKIQIGSNVYLFSYAGTFEELKADLLEEVNEQINDIVTCPFCGIQYLRSNLMENGIDELSHCECGAQIRIERSKMSEGHRWVSDVDIELWEEATTETGIQQQNNEHIDNVFSNINYVGKGNSSWKIYFLTLPWIPKSSRNTI